MASLKFMTSVRRTLRCCLDSLDVEECCRMLKIFVLKKQVILPGLPSKISAGPQNFSEPPAQNFGEAQKFRRAAASRFRRLVHRTSLPNFVGSWASFSPAAVSKHDSGRMSATSWFWWWLTVLTLLSALTQIEGPC